MHLRSATPAMVLAGVLLAGCGGGGAKKAPVTATTPTQSTPAAAASAVPASAGGGVAIEGFKYMPASVSATVGAKLTFKNADSAGHTATADMRSAFDTGAINQGQSKTVTLTKAGTFAYHCDFHPFMHGTVVVKPAAAGARAGTSNAAAAKQTTIQSTPSAPTPQGGRSGGVGGGAGGGY